MTKSKGGRPATGWVQWRKGSEGEHWYAQVTLKDGTRSDWVSLPVSIPNGPPGSPGHLAAKAAAKVASDDARLHGMVRRTTTAKTVKEYAKTWIEWRTGKVRSVGDNASHLEHHILPVLGPLAIVDVTRADIEGVVAALDAKVRKGEMGAKTARNIWGTCSKLFDDATNAKEATGLRCLSADPSIGVRGPDDDGADKLLAFLYPSEFAAFIACEEVPRQWRRNVAIAVYLGLRVGEQAAAEVERGGPGARRRDHPRDVRPRRGRGPRGDEERRRSRRPDPSRATTAPQRDARRERREGIGVQAPEPARPGRWAPTLAHEGRRHPGRAPHPDERLSAAAVARPPGVACDVARGGG